jgi:hypothetical protein
MTRIVVWGVQVHKERLLQQRRWMHRLEECHMHTQLLVRCAHTIAIAIDRNYECTAVNGYAYYTEQDAHAMTCEQSK